MAMHKAVESFTANLLDGTPVIVNRDRSYYDEEHELVRRFPQFFRPVEESRPDVEQATKEPGEKRGAKTDARIGGDDRGRAGAGAGARGR